jgi:RNA polymerase sigma factor (sigma-70 family)
MALSDLYRLHARRLERMVARMLGSTGDAADLAQDAFLRAYAAELGDRTQLSSALLTVTARRLALNEIRNRTRRATDSVGEIEAFGVPAIDNPAVEAERAELRRSLDSAVAMMPPRCRQVFVMRKLDGMTHQEIAAALGISPKTVERHLTKAITICRDKLTADGHAPTASVGGRRA